VIAVANEWEAANRLRKARRLAAVLAAVLDRNPDLSADDLVERATDETRRLAAEAAGTTLPSDETWLWAVELARARRSPV
jgi:hypothetical protein